MGEHFIADWNPLEESPTMNGAWGKREDQKDTPAGPEVCWDYTGQYEPLGLADMTEDEKEVEYLVLSLQYWFTDRSRSCLRRLLTPL